MLNFVNDQPTKYVESVAAMNILRVCNKVGVFCLRFDMEERSVRNKFPFLL